jgi:putative transposase
MEAKQRQLKGLASAPRRRNRNNFDSVLITKELFRFKELVDADGVVTKHLQLGTKKNPVGFLDFNAHRDYAIPKQITVRHTGRHWWLSFSYEHAAPESFVPRNDAELAYELNVLDDDALGAVTLGVDRNVKDNCVSTSDGRFYTLSAILRERIRRKRQVPNVFSARWPGKLEAQKIAQRPEEDWHQSTNIDLTSPVISVIKLAIRW